MGSLAYTAGDRTAFRRDPDVKLAAHEAAHVVQQRAGVHLKDGVGRPGDGYEEQADAVADAVERGESAEPLLDRSPAGTAGPAALADQAAWPEAQVPVQPRLAINATRLFEPPAPPAPVARGAGGGAPPANAKPSEGGKAGSAEASPKEKEAAVKGDASMPPEAEATGTAGGSGTGAAGAGQPAGAGEPACVGPGSMHCYQEPAEEPPENTERQEPPEPEATKAKEEMSGDTEELPEPDKCPAEKALAEQAPAPGAAPGGAVQGGAPPAGVAPAEGAGTRPGGTTAGAQPAAGGVEGAGGAPGGGEAEVAQSAGDAGFDGAIAQADVQRDNAVAAYMESSIALSGAVEGTRGLRANTRFTPADTSSAEATRSAEAGSRVDSFFTGTADRLDAAIAFASQDVPDRLGAQAEAAKSRLAAAIETQKSAISSRIEQARGQALAGAATARNAVLFQADAFAKDAAVQTAAAIETLRASHAGAMEQVNGLETTTLDQVNQIYADGRAAHEALGVTVGNECIARGEEFAAFYLTPLPAGCWTKEKDSFFKGYLTQRRAEAQANAARESAKGFRKSLIDSARKRGREVTKAGRKADRCAVIAAASQARDTLDQQLTSITAALEAARDSTIQQASETRDTIIASIETNLAATLHQLDQQEHDQRQAADDTGYLQQVLQEQTAHTATAALQRSVTDAVGAAQSGLAMVRARFAGSTAPDLAVLDEALALVARNIDGAVGNLEAALKSGATAAEAQLAGAAQQGIASLDAVTQSSNELAAAIQGGFGSAMNTIAGTDNFSTLRSGFTQQVKETAAGGSDALSRAVAGMLKACDAVTSGAESSLAQSAVDLEKGLRQTKQGLECEIPKRADEAAAKEAPAWKRVLAVVLIIFVVIIMIVATVVTFGSAGILAGIVVGAIVGAVTSAMITIATALLNNQKLRFWPIFRAAAIGALTGAIGGGLGAWMGGALKAAQVTSKVALFAANVGLAAGLDIGFQFFSHGRSFKNFSFTELGMQALIAAVTFGIGAKFGGRIKIGGGTKGAPAPAPAAPAAEAVPAPAPAAPAAEAVPAPAPAAPAAEAVPAPAPAAPAAEAVPAPAPAAPAAEAVPAPAPAAPAAEAVPAPAPAAPAAEAVPAPAPAAPAAEAVPAPAPAAPAAEAVPAPAVAPEKEVTAPAAAQGEEELPPVDASTDEITPATLEEEQPGAKEPWEQGSRPKRYAAYRSRFAKQNPGKEPLSPEQWWRKTGYERYAKGREKPLGEGEWWEQFGRKPARNPYGGVGDEDHVTVVGNLRIKATTAYPPPRYAITSNQEIPTAGRVRKPDVAVIDTETGKVVKVYEAARFNASGQFEQVYEAPKILDYEAAGIPYEFHPVGPNKPPGGVLTSPATSSSLSPSPVSEE
jgi:hypothetical protein